MRGMGRTWTYWTADAVLDVKVHGLIASADGEAPAPVPHSASVPLLGAALVGVGAVR